MRKRMKAVHVFASVAIGLAALGSDRDLGMQLASAQTIIPEDTAMPENMDRGLHYLLKLHSKDPQAAFKELASPNPRGLPTFQHDPQGKRPLVTIYLDGTVPLISQLFRH